MCVCVCTVVCVTCPYTQKGARAHTQTDTWWFTGCVPTCLLSVLWCRVLARDGDGTDTAENLTQQAKRPPSSLLLSIIYLFLLLVLLLLLLLKIFLFWKLWTPRQWPRPPQEENQRIVRIFQLKERKNKQFSFNNRVGWCQTPTIQQRILSWLFKKKDFKNVFKTRWKLVMQFRFIFLCLVLWFDETVSSWCVLRCATVIIHCIVRQVQQKEKASSQFNSKLSLPIS